MKKKVFVSWAVDGDCIDLKERNRQRVLIRTLLMKSGFDAIWVGDFFLDRDISHREIYELIKDCDGVLYVISNASRMKGDFLKPYLRRVIRYDLMEKWEGCGGNWDRFLEECKAGISYYHKVENISREGVSGTEVEAICQHVLKKPYSIVRRSVLTEIEGVNEPEFKAMRDEDVLLEKENRDILKCFKYEPMMHEPRDLLGYHHIPCLRFRAPIFDVYGFPSWREVKKEGGGSWKDANASCDMFNIGRYGKGIYGTQYGCEVDKDGFEKEQERRCMGCRLNWDEFEEMQASKYKVKCKPNP